MEKEVDITVKLSVILDNVHDFLKSIWIFYNSGEFIRGKCFIAWMVMRVNEMK
jgi:hypothetical protein